MCTYLTVFYNVNFNGEHHGLLLLLEQEHVLFISFIHDLQYMVHDIIFNKYGKHNISYILPGDYIWEIVVIFQKFNGIAYEEMPKSDDKW